MKNKFGVIVLCAAIIMSLCACKPLNIHSDSNSSSNGGNNNASGAVSVGFVIEKASTAQNTITVSDPTDREILFQYKAIPNFTSEKEIAGATGDVWTDLDSVTIGQEFKKDFSTGEWTFYLQGVDKKDKTIKYQLAEPVKKNITSDFKDTIKLQVEAVNPGDADGVGDIQLNITATGEEMGEFGWLRITLLPRNGDNYQEQEVNTDGEGYTASENSFEYIFTDIPDGTYDISLELYNNDGAYAYAYLEAVVVEAGKITYITGDMELELPDVR